MNTCNCSATKCDYREKLRCNARSQREARCLHASGGATQTRERMIEAGDSSRNEQLMRGFTPIICSLLRQSTPPERTFTYLSESSAHECSCKWTKLYRMGLEKLQRRGGELKCFCLRVRESGRRRRQTARTIGNGGEGGRARRGNLMARVGKENRNASEYYALTVNHLIEYRVLCVRVFRTLVWQVSREFKCNKTGSGSWASSLEKLRCHQCERHEERERSVRSGGRRTATRFHCAT